MQPNQKSARHIVSKLRTQPVTRTAFGFFLLGCCIAVLGRSAGADEAELAEQEQNPSSTEPRATTQFDFILFGEKANQKLSEDFHGYQGNNLKPLPRGEQRFAKVPFMVGDGMIQLASKRAPDFPESVKAIPVGKTCSSIHFLHGTGWGSPGVEAGTVLGHYAVHYEDSTTEKIPIVYGVDVRDWWQLADAKEPSRATVAWSGVNEASRKFRTQEVEIRLYLSTWKNPHPALKIVSLDFVTLNETKSAPFCVAITLQTVPDEEKTISMVRQHGGFVQLDNYGHAKAVTLSARRAKPEAIKLLSHLPKLARLDLSNNKLPEAQWEMLPPLTGLRSLSLNETNVGDEFLARLEKWSALERLGLHKTRVSDRGLKHLPLLKNLKVLDLSDTEVTDEGMIKLRRIEGLEKLDLRGTRVTELGLAVLAQKIPDCIVKL